MVLVIGIFGSSGSGKTTIAKEIMRKFNAVLVNMDNFYYGIAKDIPDRENFIKTYNFDLPSAITWDLVRDVIYQLQYHPVDMPEYDFATHTHSDKSRVYMNSTGCDYIIVEGIHVWKLADLCDLLVYIDTDLDECFRRRLNRDKFERGRIDDNEIASNWDKKVKPAFREFILPNAYKAHFTLRNEEPHKIAHLNCLYSIIECLGKYPLPEIKL